MKKRNPIITCTVLGILIIGIVMIAAPSAKELLGISSVESANIESVQFTQHLGTPQTWSTFDPHIIEDLMNHFEHVVLLPTMGGVGGYLRIRFNLKEPIDNKLYYDITLLGPTCYVGQQLRPDSTQAAYRVILGAKSDEEWNAILAQCERQ